MTLQALLLHARRFALTGALAAIAYLATGTAVQAAPAAPAAPPAWTDISASGDVVCAVDTSDRAWCWGNNGSGGNLGAGLAAMAQSSTPVQVAIGTPTTSVATGRGMSGSCALSKGRAWCWSAAFGPVPVDAGLPADLSAVSVGGRSVVCALTRSQKVACVGPDDLRLASGGAALTGVTQVSVGGTSACAVSQGRAWCWGSTAKDQLGTRMPSAASAAATLVPGPLEVASVSVGDGFACAVDGSGRVWCWGDGYFGQTARPAASARMPQPVALPVLAAGVSASGASACALGSDGSAWCWGANFAGQLGDGTRQAARQPVQVDFDGRATAVSAGTSNACLLDQDGQAWCWGAWQRLGVPAQRDSLIPVRVR